MFYQNQRISEVSGDVGCEIIRSNNDNIKVPIFDFVINNLEDSEALKNRSFLSVVCCIGRLSKYNSERADPIFEKLLALLKENQEDCVMKALSSFMEYKLNPSDVILEIFNIVFSLDVSVLEKLPSSCELIANCLRQYPNILSDILEDEKFNTLLSQDSTSDTIIIG
ncbi:hypothetical protein TVAG_122770 [Trichomonas vaginalis G3]|uniref:Clathrin/coatomer adaptor adaptin-like N-terminal domain-containing protein n=1 Tax=Trichomonas vaginalis (strain ATCC PRA-98 / G3) TaxID=412133 RepID=A2DN34_TRIV3|nr:armadillo (ARM) repeat-containing protein family [Trichomonas vaginalis G3]EAY18211.1 hypothetical protein TVAG_122770 [Trichomonas vaginalis G3]KAI5491513.1 armadillo (ARM) repeat-containing protein family [Trichomonas vaginalis G3]|eukprot:XP_001579197.1 hypothetical protein [Trichomonas vaginalis G3]